MHPLTSSEDLLSSVDKPLKVQRCQETGKNYLTCDYNRDGDSFRSPWSNKYYPSIEDEAEAPHPSKVLRQLEQYANDSFDIYRDLYYEGGISSVYLWDQDTDVDESGSVEFAGVVLLKKEIDANTKDAGSWDSIHVFEVVPGSGKSAAYKITSTVILDLSTEDNSDNSIYLSGNLTRQTEKSQTYTDSNSHISSIGSMVEEIESKLRNMLQEVYFGKTRDILGDLRSTQDIEVTKSERNRQQEVVKGIQGL
ncbi:unnamed protein product [Kuraishia capsulata CBS 1993]|uniref:F-actin-capping protein subunit beta n=1 Tax=Kuraishia capsulata CBS 1993 TaxID=1382522 RepID=W6MK95_9ASCO|nr:uncharacterized protein KUCA_T00001004001 [Kuraishia capsulata CBS 1993]CDK25037.1 unnamed protein product [Kuraishia capsulata CBS 1993]